nr:hypothetical protein [Tanacetum cinerariifolium]
TYQEATRPLPVIEGKGKAIAIEEQVAQSMLALHTPKRRSITDQFILQRRTPATKEGPTRPSAQPHDGASANIFHESPSPADVETDVDSNKTTSGGDTKILQIDEDQGKDVDNQVNLEENTAELDQGQARSNPEEPLSSSGTLSSMKNLDDAYTFREQFLNDKSTEDELHLNRNSLLLSKRARLLIIQLRILDLRELPKADMKEILHQRMFENGSCKSLPEHALYKALEASMDRANRDKFLAKKDKSRKRRRNDQDPPPPPLGLDPSKRRRHDSGDSRSTQTQLLNPQPRKHLTHRDGNLARANIKQALGRSSQDLEVQVKMEMEIPHFNGVYFITACSYSTDTSKELMKVQVYVLKLPQL